MVPAVEFVKRTPRSCPQRPNHVSLRPSSRRTESDRRQLSRGAACGVGERRAAWSRWVRIFTGVAHHGHVRAALPRRCPTPRERGSLPPTRPCCPLGGTRLKRSMYAACECSRTRGSAASYRPSSRSPRGDRGANSTDSRKSSDAPGSVLREGTVQRCGGVRSCSNRDLERLSHRSGGRAAGCRKAQFRSVRRRRAGSGPQESCGRGCGC